MKTRIATIALAATLAALLAAPVAGAAMIGIYRNGMESLAQRSQLVKLTGASCARRAAEGALQVAVGKRTEACALRTPVVGRDIEIGATMRLLTGTPPALKRKAFLGLELRAGGGSKYQLLAFPAQRKVQLRKLLPGGEVRYLAVAKGLKDSLGGLDMPNSLRLRAANLTSGPEKGVCNLVAFVGATAVIEASDRAAGELAGRASAVSVGALGNGNGVIASVDDLVIRVPSPF